MVQQLALPTLELQKKNSGPHREESTSGVNHKIEGYGEVNREVISRSVMIDFPFLQGEDPLVIRLTNSFYFITQCHNPN